MVDNEIKGIIVSYGRGISGSVGYWITPIIERGSDDYREIVKRGNVGNRIILDHQWLENPVGWDEHLSLSKRMVEKCKRN